jgi:plasmid stabilization system protein ParE
MDELTQLLRKRLEMIADHSFRDRDPDAHLDALKDVSEKVMALHLQMRDGGQLRPRLEHFLANCSYDKALAWIEEN